MYRGRYRSRPGRSNYSTRNTESSRDIRLYYQSDFLAWIFQLYGIDINTYQPIEDNKPKEEEEKPKPKPLKVKDVDLRIADNTKLHNTSEYEITEPHIIDGEKRSARLVSRRGQDIKITVKFDREFDKDNDDIKVLMHFGEEPKASKGTLKTLNTAEGLKNRHWSAMAEKNQNEEVELTIRSPPDCIVGKWKFHIVTSRKTDDSVEGKTEKIDYAYENPIYILFNPWCKDDSVYMNSEVELEEYILNDGGKIYSGNYKQIASKPWNFDQFEDFVLDCCLMLLDMAHVGPMVRGNPVAVIRAISAIVNAPDDGGVLVGNWSGNYSDGTAPTSWVGSGPILEEFWKTKEPVKYGQCWVFSGLCTTVCRAIGIPARSVTNFSSAHDCDGSMTIDYHWADGNSMPELNDDSVWNFHVWNEAWLNRPDLPPALGGWQAFDATPQETSGGIYCAGPAPVAAIKKGLVNLPYDTPFIFAEVNADKVNWLLEDGEFKPKTILKNKVGRSISTKKPDKQKREGRLPQGEDPDRLDITLNYKYKEGSQEERAAVYRANTHSTVPGIYDTTPKDVKFEVQQKDHILVGSPFDVVLYMQNTSREERTVTVDITLNTQYYTGVPKAQVKKNKFEVILQPIKSDRVVMPVTPEEYMTRVVDQVSFQICVMAHVHETKQLFADQDDFRLRRPDLILEAPKIVKMGEPFDLKITMTNSTPESLTHCEWQIEGPGIQKTMRKSHRDLEPYEKDSITVSLTPRRLGTRQIVASFQSNELMDVTGAHVVTVKA